MKRRETTSSDIEEILSIALRPQGPAGGPPKFQATASRGQLVSLLKSFGEDSAAERVKSLTDDEMQRIFTSAAPKFLQQQDYTQALCIAAIELIEGRSRELARKKPKNVT